MTRVDEFDAFYDGTRRHVLHLAYAFTGDLTAAVAATQDAYASAWQHWSKLRDGEPLEVVRPESLQVAALRHGAHLVRRKPPPEADAELIAALRALPSNGRRIVLLQTVGDLDLARASREVGVTPEEGLRLTDACVNSLERELGVSIIELERRLHGMHAMTDAAPLPRASIIRRTGSRRHRRATALAVATCAALVLGGGYFVTAPAQTAPAAQPPREGLTATAPSSSTPPPPPTGPVVEADQLLDTTALTPVGGRDWRQRITSDDLTDQQPLVPCAQGRFVSPRLLAGFTRTFTGRQKHAERAVQTVELTGSREAALRAYDQQLAWYSGCQEPRVQLMQSYVAERSRGDTTILVLRRWTQPAVTMTVAIGRTGAAMTTLVHQTSHDDGVDLDAFAAAVDRALGQLCVSAEGYCEVSDDPAAVPPPSTGEGTGFLGVVDLPPVPDIGKGWGGTEPLRWRPTPPVTPCEAVDFSRGAELARSRDYVIPGVERLPLTFGISETIARFRSSRAAQDFVARAADEVAACDEDRLGAEVSDPVTVSQGTATGTVWEMTFSVADDEEASYRMGLVVNGARVAQLTFSPVGSYDIDETAYERLLLRAGQRLSELPEARKTDARAR